MRLIKLNAININELRKQGHTQNFVRRTVPL